MMKSETNHGSDLYKVPPPPRRPPLAPSLDENKKINAKSMKDKKRMRGCRFSEETPQKKKRNQALKINKQKDHDG